MRVVSRMPPSPWYTPLGPQRCSLFSSCCYELIKSRLVALSDVGFKKHHPHKQGVVAHAFGKQRVGCDHGCLFHGKAIHTDGKQTHRNTLERQLSSRTNWLDRRLRSSNLSSIDNRSTSEVLFLSSKLFYFEKPQSLLRR